MYRRLLVKLLSVNTALFDQRPQHLNRVGILALGPNILLHIASEPEGQLLPRNLVHDAFGVVVSKATTEFVVVHLWLILLLAPETSNLVGLEDAKLILVTCPVHHLTVAG